MFKNFRIMFRNYSTYIKKYETNEVKNLVEKLKKNNFYSHCNISSCHCLHYGEPCKLYNNKEANMNFKKHILNIKTKKTNLIKSNVIYNNHLNQWYF
jgi:hypothetical protein